MRWQHVSADSVADRLGWLSLCIALAPVSLLPTKNECADQIIRTFKMPAKWSVLNVGVDIRRISTKSENIAARSAITDHVSKRSRNCHFERSGVRKVDGLRRNRSALRVSVAGSPLFGCPVPSIAHRADERRRVRAALRVGAGKPIGLNAHTAATWCPNTGANIATCAGRFSV